MGVDDIDMAEAAAHPDECGLHAEHPGQEVRLGEFQRWRIMWDADNIDATESLPHGLDACTLRQHGHLVAARSLSFGEGMHVAAKPAVDHRGVLPRHVEYAHPVSIGPGAHWLTGGNVVHRDHRRDDHAVPPVRHACWPMPHPRHEGHP